jgi:hypothetical protein
MGSHIRWEWFRHEPGIGQGVSNSRLPEIVWPLHPPCEWWRRGHLGQWGTLCGSGVGMEKWWMITCTVYEPFLHELSGKSAQDSSVAAVKGLLLCHGWSSEVWHMHQPDIKSNSIESATFRFHAYGLGLGVGT